MTGRNFSAKTGWLGQRGDTLVEVLICILIVTVILTGAYVTTNRSTLGVRNSQEHAEALKLAQGQLEQIRQNAASADPKVFDQTETASFCMVAGLVVATADQAQGAKCTQDSSGTPTTGQPAYKLSAGRKDCNVGVGCSQFTIQATWESVTGSGQAREQIVYRLHK